MFDSLLVKALLDHSVMPLLILLDDPHSLSLLLFQLLLHSILFLHHARKSLINLPLNFHLLLLHLVFSHSLELFKYLLLLNKNLCHFLLHKRYLFLLSLKVLNLTLLSFPDILNFLLQMHQIVVEPVDDLALNLPNNLVLINFIFLHAILLHDLSQLGP